MQNESNFSKKLALFVGVVLVLLLAWQLADLLLLVFASVLVAIFFRALADVIAKPTALSPGWSLAIAVLLVAVLVVLITVLFGATIRQNVDTLMEQLPTAWRAVRERIGDAGWLTSALERSGQALLSGNVVSRIGGALGAVVGTVTNLFLVLFAGLYIAAQPGLYRDGFLKLVPPQERDRIDATIARCGTSLRNWLLGQVIAMVTVGVLTWAGARAARGALGARARLVRGIGGIRPDIGGRSPPQSRR
jgi:predicted PurR-regulated permease PerM